MMEFMTPPPVNPLKHWTDVTLPFYVGRPNNFLTGENAPQRHRLVYYRDSKTRAIVGRAWFGPQAEGPPGHAHGGSIAAILDEIMGTTVWIDGHSVVAVKLSLEFKNMLPVGTDCFFHSKIIKKAGRKFYTKGYLSEDEKGKKIFARATGIFVALSPAQLERVKKKLL